MIKNTSSGKLKYLENNHTRETKKQLWAEEAPQTLKLDPLRLPRFEEGKENKECRNRNGASKTAIRFTNAHNNGNNRRGERHR